MGHFGTRPWIGLRHTKFTHLYHWQMQMGTGFALTHKQNKKDETKGGKKLKKLKGIKRKDIRNAYFVEGIHISYIYL